jgi:hypothetical protein
MFDISVIIVNWNTQELLLKVLESVERVGKNLKMELFVVDNGSSDQSVEMVKSKFPWARLIENSENLGFARANNQALREVSGRYALLLNSDTVLKDKSLEELINFMDKNRDVGIVGGQLLEGNGKKGNSFENFPSLATELFNKSLLKMLFPKRYPGRRNEYTSPIDVDSIIGACMMVRKKAIDEVGMLDEDYFFFLEETDWCFRMKKGGWKVCHVPTAEIFHLRGGSVKNKQAMARIEYYRSRYLFFEKHRGKINSFILTGGLFFRLILDLLLLMMGNLLTLFGVKELRTKLSTYFQLLLWHLRFCPPDLGLRHV